MSTSPAPEELPVWTRRNVPTFTGLFDSKIETGEDYATQPLGVLFNMKPWNKAKASGPAFVPSLHHDYDAREHAAQREKGSFVALTGDIDSGDHAIEAVVEAVKAFVGDAAWLVYSSPHARPGDMRWRIIVPLDEPQRFETWYDAQSSFFAFMEARGFVMDRALARAAQPVFLPNVPEQHAKSGTALRGDNGETLHFQRRATASTLPGLNIDEGAISEGIAAIRARRAEDERIRERVRREAEVRRAASPLGDGASLMEDFNAANSVATMLELCGYEQSPRGAEDWRSPHQTGGTYATRIIGSKWVSLSSSDAAANVGATFKEGCYGDAYDLYVHYKHGGDHKAAYRALGQEKRAANIIDFPRPEVPEWMSQIPPPEEAPEWAAFEADVGEIGGDVPEAEADALTIHDAFDYDEAAIPVRPWLVPGASLAGYTHMLAAPGGSGKSLFTLQLAIAMADGVQWGGFKPRRRYRSLIINVEDDIYEQRRRISAARRVMDPKNDLRGMIHIVDASDSIVVARAGERHDSIVATPVVDVLRRYIIDNEIDAIFVDPFAETFEGDENDNSQVKWAMRIWRDDIARATGCAVHLVHHTTKYAQNGAGDANVVRGAGAIVNSTRISATLMPMTADDAAMVGIDPEERHLYVRYDDAKANQSLKTNAAKWFRKESIELDNATADCPADIVGALVPWSPPDAFECISSHQIGIVLDKVEAGLPSGERYTASTKGGSKSSGRWVGCLLNDVTGMGEAQAKKVIATWIKNDVLVEDDYDCPVQRKSRKGLFAPQSNRPGAPS